jgi:VanZ family protein
MLLWRALRGGTRWQIKMSILLLIAWVACAIFAASDEFHQSFVPSRTASPTDVMIDTCGALAGLLTCLILARRKSAPAFASAGK